MPRCRVLADMVTYDDIAAIAHDEGSFVSAYLESPSAQPNAAFTLTTRWKTMRAQLAASGAADETLCAVDAAIGVDTEAVRPQPDVPALDNEPTKALDQAADHEGGDVLAIIASGDRVLIRQPLQGARSAGIARVGGVASLVPLLDALARSVPYVVVMADRRGADIQVCGPDGAADEEIVDGSHDVIERSAPGGWSQKRYQQRAIDSWERNAHEVASAAQEACEQISARLLLVGGDDHAVMPFLDALHQPWSQRAKRIDHATRGPSGDSALVAAEVRRLVNTVVAEETAGLLQRFRQGIGQQERAANGPDAVFAALQAANVETLLVHDDDADEREAWFGPEPTHLAIDPGELEAMNVHQRWQARLVDIAVRAALGTGATVVSVPASTIDSGLGALLRW